MPVLGKKVGIDKINKFYLEQALLAYSFNGFLEKCVKINAILNQVVKNEMESGHFDKHVRLTDEEYQEIFG